MHKLRFFRRCGSVTWFLVAVLVSLAGRHAGAQAPHEGQSYARKNSFGVFAAYSPDSSHILLGVAEKRKLWNFGVSYSRRLIARHGMNWQYDGELLPIALVGDPLSRQVVRQTSPTVQTIVFNSGPAVFCAPSDQTYTFIDPHGTVYKGDISSFCHGRQWTVGEAMSPVGFRANFLARKRIEPVGSAHIGYMYSTQAVPIDLAGSFNFTFDFGAGVELFRSPTRSLRIEYRFHHISNHDSALSNPGIDNGLFQLGYVFGH